MPNIIALVEGPGDQEAVPVLLRRLLANRGEYTWQVPQPMQVGSMGALRKKLANFITYAAAKSNCGGILVLLDLDDGCPMQEAQALAADIRALASPVPTAIVLAHREYEAWFLASLATIAGSYELPAGLTYPQPVEGLRGVKGWITRQMPAGRIYKETYHQVRFTHLLDPTLAAARSRSFRRLEHAVDELLLLAQTAHRGVATP